MMGTIRRVFGRHETPIRNRGEGWFPTDEQRELREARTIENLARAKAERTAERAERYLRTFMETALTPPANDQHTDRGAHS